MPTARLILDPPAAGAWNMAVDEALLRSAGETKTLTLRIYRWEEPTLSLGYFQEAAERRQHAASGDCPLVRRATGGGAIVHDREVTYSMTAPISDRMDRAVLSWYDLAHDTWMAALAEHGVQSLRCPPAGSQVASEFLCFQRREAGDLLLDRYKVGGSAQRRHRDAVLQHGSLLMDRSPAAPELPGIANLAGIDLDTTSWQEDWIRALGDQLQVSWIPGSLTDQEAALSEQLASEKFGSPKWTLRR